MVYLYPAACVRARLFRTSRNTNLRPVFVAALLLAAFVLPTVLVAPFADAQTVIATVAKVPAPVALAYDSSKGEVFAANYQDDTVSVVSNANDSVIATVKVGI